LKIEFEGRTWQLDLDEVDMAQGETIAAYTGLSIMAWYKSLLDTDAVAWNKSARCLYWLMRQQNGEPVPLETANFAPIRLFTAFGEGLAADSPAAEAEEDPTKPAGAPGGREPKGLQKASPAG
jgi:hypothetical protein